MQQPGKSARGTRSREHGERHGQTELAHEETEDESASTRAAATLNSRQRDRHHAHHCASEISPRRQSGNTEVPTHQHTICRDAEVPSSTQSAPYLPLGLIRMRIEQIRESPLGLDPRAAELPICIPMVCPISQTAGRRLPAYPFPPGRATDGSAVSLFTRWFTVKRHTRCKVEP